MEIIDAHYKNGYDHDRLTAAIQAANRPPSDDPLEELLRQAAIWTVQIIHKVLDLRQAL